MDPMKPVPHKQTTLDALTNLILKGRVEAICFAMLFYFVPYFSFLSSVSVALVTLRRGVKEGLFVTIVAMTPALLVATLQTHVLLSVVEVLVTFGVMWLFASALYQFRSWTYAIYTALLLALFIGLVAHISFPNHVNESKQMLREMFTLLQQNGTLKYDAAMMDENINWFADYFLGMQLAVSTLIVLFNLGLARYMQSKVFYPGGFAREFLYFRLTPGLAFLFIGCLVGLMLAVNFVKMLVVVSALPLIFAGLSLMHWRVRRYAKGRLLVLIPSYFLLITFPFTFAPLMVVGFADMWFDFRNFKAQENTSS